MLKTTYTPQKTCIELPISNEYIGQKVEVVYEIYRVPKESKKEDCQSSNDISDIFDKHLYSFGNFKFNRNEANDYEQDSIGQQYFNLVHDLDCEDKRLIARGFFKENPVVSSQVIAEYLNVMRRDFKIEKRELMSLCSLWLEKCSVQPIVSSTIKLAQNLIKRYDFQIFDGIIVSAALEANCDTLYSEDMQNGQVIENTLRIVNPFV